MNTPREIICTVPKSMPRELLLRQLTGCNGRIAWHLCVNRLPKEQPTRMHFVHDGEVIGSLPVLDMIDWCGRDLRRADGTPLSTKDRKFAIRAAGAFRVQSLTIRMKGFQGWRYWNGTAKCPTCAGLEACTNDGELWYPCPDCAGFK